MTLEAARQETLKALATIYEGGEAQAIARLLVETMADIDAGIREDWSKKLFPEEKIALFHEHIQRLQQHEPLQYVLEEVWFAGLKLYVDKRVLIPRPETEELVDWVIRDCRFPIDTLTILDVGTGSGCIPLTLKKRIRRADIWACDVSEDALAVAQLNADRLRLPIQLQKLDFIDQQEWLQLPIFDCIVSNPPYIPRSDESSMDKNVLAYEPDNALFVHNDDALLFYKLMVKFGQQHLAKDGYIYMEMYAPFADATRKLFEEGGYTVTIKEDMQGKERMIRAKLI